MTVRDSRNSERLLRITSGAATMAFAIVGLGSLGVRISHGPALWPDVGCQTYLGWRVASGDALYTQLWDSHPPAAALYAALFHLVAPPSDTLVVVMLLVAAVLYASASTTLLRVAIGRMSSAALAAALVLAGYYLLSFAGIRSEDLIAISASWTVTLILIGTRSHHELAYMMAAGVVAGVGLVAKPAGASVILVGTLLIASASQVAPHTRKLALFALGGCLVPLLTLAWLVAAESARAAWDGIVSYGRWYFRPYTLDVAGEFVHHVMYGPVTFCVFALVLLAPLKRHWLPTLLSWWPGRARERAFWVLFVAWPLLDALMVQPQTTMFQYVVHPLGLTSLTLAAMAAVSFIIQLRAEPVSRADLARALTQSLAGTTIFVGFGAWAWTTTHPAGVPPPSIQMLLGFSATLAIATALANHERLLALLPEVVLRRVLVATVVAALAWAITFMPFVSEWKRVRLRSITERPYRESVMYELANALRSLDLASYGGAAWFDIAPSLYYLAQLKQPVREYLTAPLFLDGYATEKTWDLHAKTLVHANPAMIFEWTEWFSLSAPRPHLENFGGYKQTLRFIDEQYEPLGDTYPYTGRAALRIHVRRDLMTTLGCASRRAIGALLHPTHEETSTSTTCSSR